MHKEFKRKPNRKSIIRSDDSRHKAETVEHSRERRSSNIKRKLSDHSDKASMRGRVVGSAGNLWFVVEEAQLHSIVGEFTDYVECHVGGVAITNNDDDTLVCVGDYVKFAPSLSHKEKGVIIEIENRKTRLLRKTAGERKLMQAIASNIDQAIIVNSAAEPFYNRRLIDRYLISAEQGGLQPAIIINKIELMIEDMLREDLQCYEQLGIPVVFCSCVNGKGIDELKKLFAGKTSVLAGASGVGKSSIVNACFGIELQAVREISVKYDKGKHTTTTGKIFALPEGGSIIDTPGMREFALTDLHVDDLSFYFHEFDRYFQACKYLPCTHTHEPDCAVKQALEDGLIDELRYDSYLRIRESLA